MQECMDHAFEHLELIGDRILIADGCERARVIAQRVILCCCDIASRHVVRHIVQEEIRVRRGLQLFDVVRIELLVEHPVLFGKAIPRATQKTHG